MADPVIVTRAKWISAVGGAIIVVTTIMSWVLPKIWHAALVPAFAYADGRIASVESTHKSMLQSWNQHQLDLLTALSYPSGSEGRRKAVEAIRIKWAREALGEGGWDLDSLNAGQHRRWR